MFITVSWPGLMWIALLAILLTYIAHRKGAKVWLWAIISPIALFLSALLPIPSLIGMVGCTIVCGAIIHMTAPS